MSTVMEVMKMEGKKTDTSIYWEYINNAANERYNFKQFSDPCIEFWENKENEAKRIFGMFEKELKTIISKLK